MLWSFDVWSSYMLPHWAVLICFLFFFKQKTAYDMRISDWSSDVCSSDLVADISPAQHLDRAGRPRLAYRHVAGAGPTIVFLPGYMSDMEGGKATALFAWAAAEGRACLLLDYAGCGSSDGLFSEQTLLDWRGDVLDLIDAKVDEIGRA